jgi:site-specific DNA-cytosine methylase
MSKVMEFCCGYGGVTQGIKQAGLQIEAAYDIWPRAIEAHKRWHPETPCFEADVKEIKPFELRDRFVWASLPCQPWSIANRTKKRGKAHPHYYSLAHFAWQVRYAKAAIIENVAGLVTEKDGKQEIAELEKACQKYGLTLSINLIPSAWLGGSEKNRYAFLLINCFGLFQAQRDRKKLHPKVTAEEANRGRRKEPNDFANNSYDLKRDVKDQARIRQVPLEHIAHMPKQVQGTLIGNAVPPVVAENVVRACWL